MAKLKIGAYFWFTVQTVKKPSQKGTALKSWDKFTINFNDNELDIISGSFRFIGSLLKYFLRRSDIYF